MLAYWPLQSDLRNYGAVAYGKVAQKEEHYYRAGDFHFSGTSFFSFSGNSGGELFNQGDVSVGLINLKNGLLPYLRSAKNFYRPDQKYANSGGYYSIEFKQEDFADKEYTLRFYKDSTLLYTNGVDFITFSGTVLFPLDNTNKFADFKVFSENQIEKANNPTYDFPFFGASSGTLGQGIPLFLGPPLVGVGSGVNLSLNGVDGCYLLDESGNILYDELGNPLYAEGCTPTIGIIGGFDMYISGNNILSSSIPLYLHQAETTYRITSGIPLYMDGRNVIGGSVNLFLNNLASGIGSGVLLYIGNQDGLNDGFVPISSGFPLYLHRAENVLQGMNCFISGGTVGISGSVNLTLEATKTPFGTGINLSIPYIYDRINSGINLYSIGW